MKKINIFLVDDHSLFREGIRFLLSNLDIIGEIYEAENGTQFINELKIHHADVALLDIEMPEKNGIMATTEALQICPDIKIIALSMYSDENYYSSMIEAGASGFLLKNSKFAEVKKAIEDVHAGKNYFSLEILQSILNKINHFNTNPPHVELTEREIEILGFICNGFSNIEIADQLEISKRTVDKHRENLLQKTHSKNTAHLIIYAIKNKYFKV